MGGVDLDGVAVLVVGLHGLDGVPEVEGIVGGDLDRQGAADLAHADRAVVRDQRHVLEGEGVIGSAVDVDFVEAGGLVPQTVEIVAESLESALYETAGGACLPRAVFCL